MSRVCANREMRRFLENAGHEVLCVSGNWGIGKTHSWNEILNDFDFGAEPKNYAYVSAFGTRSLEELKAKIFQSTVEIGKVSFAPTIDTFRENISVVFKRYKKWAGEKYRKIAHLINEGVAGLPEIGGMSGLLNTATFLFIRDQIICIDDLERAGPNLRLEEVFGFVSDLKENRRCKIILLLNDGQLGERKDEFDRHLEKVVDRFVKFSPSAHEATALALDSECFVDQRLREYAVLLGITNIRIIKRIRGFVAVLQHDLGELDERILDRMVQSLVLIGWSLFDGSNAPDLTLIQSRGNYTSLLPEQDRSDAEKEVDEIFRKYGFLGFDNLGNLLAEGVQSGYFDNEGLAKEIENISALLVKSEVENSIHAPLNIIHTGLDNDHDKLLASFKDVFENHSPSLLVSLGIHYLKIMREVGFDEHDVSRCKEYFKTSLNSKTRDEIFANLGGTVADADEDISEILNRKSLETDEDFDVAKALLEMANSMSWSEEMIVQLSKCSVQNYVDVLKSLDRKNLNLVISRALDFGKFSDGMPEYKVVSSLMFNALTQVSSENKLNELRLKVYLK